MVQLIQQVKLLNFPLLDYTTIKWLDKIGSGATGDVYECSYQNQKYISKCFYASNYTTQNGYIYDALSELTIVSKLKHTDYCSKIYGVSYVPKSGIYFIMKHYNTIQNIYDYISSPCYWNKEYTMNRDLKCKITRSMCNAIQELHSLSIIHCDVKLKNMLYLEEEEKVILIDFGASLFLNDQKYIYVDEELGTRGYMSPELYNGYGYLKSDIYSLGVSILELWCGDIWIYEDDDMQICRNQVLRSLRSLEKKEKGLGKILRSCLVNDVKKRPSINTLLHNLKDIVYPLLR